ncbi:holo-[acyl-carrier-protein] synthase [Phytophthora boehmeriae]|uniref:Holo-[acyl-carrier-protein] synthase n=1 Tax=Phytophthora boehmeriae TaxID=109152 RepID=A0A8T1WJU6_9STRA|nr:holo-[acyl-carrier-protein] synthase [Phytophthora boehmeriae]
MKFAPLLVALVGCMATAPGATSTSVSDLPIIFFHGLGFNSSAGDTYVNNLTAENRTAVSLSFCTDSCSFESLATQVPLAVAAVRDVVANNSAFDNGYIFIGHSQGAAISRAVVEEMDDHKVKRLISLAGVQNGLFPGPNDADGLAAAGTGVLQDLLPRPDIFNFSAYASEDAYGKMQRDVVQFTLENPDLQYQYSYFNLQRSPQFGSWASSNVFFPVINNVNPCLPGNDQCIFDQRRRKANFLKLESAYFITSPQDEKVAPWQSSHFGRYSEVSSIEAIEQNFSSLTVVDMKDTLEYTSDTFGLRTLDERGGLFLPAVSNVTHACWVKDDNGCMVQNMYDTHIYPLLH